MIVVQCAKLLNYNIFTLFTQSKLNKSILNLYQNDLVGYIPKVNKIWPAPTVLLVGLYQCLFFDILSTLCMCTENDQRIKLI